MSKILREEAHVLERQVTLSQELINNQVLITLYIVVTVTSTVGFLYHYFILSFTILSILFDYIMLLTLGEIETKTAPA